MNRNIWCIEIPSLKTAEDKEKAWTETYDVLKLDKAIRARDRDANLNRNIWCIEMIFNNYIVAEAQTWTETYDVLKLDIKLEFLK